MNHRLTNLISRAPAATLDIRNCRSGAQAVLASLKRALGDLDRITAWPVVHGMVNATPGSAASTNVVNGFSDLILELFGPEVGQHARTTVGMAALPLNLAVVVAAEVEIVAESSRW